MKHMIIWTILVVVITICSLEARAELLPMEPAADGRTEVQIVPLVMFDGLFEPLSQWFTDILKEHLVILISIATVFAIIPLIRKILDRDDGRIRCEEKTSDNSFLGDKKQNTKTAEVDNYGVVGNRGPERINEMCEDDGRLVRDVPINRRNELMEGKQDDSEDTPRDW